MLDEIWKYWPVGQKQTQAEGSAVELLRMHRHRVGPVGERELSQEIVLINQGKRFAAWIKELVDKTYCIRKLDAIGAHKRYRLDIYQGFQEPERPLKRDHIRGFVGRYDPRIFQLYKSHTQSAGEVANPEELRADKTATVWSGWTVKGAIAGIVIAVIAVSYVLGNVDTILGADEAAASPSPKPAEEMARPPQGRESAAGDAMPVQAGAAVAQDVRRISQWRLVGSMQYLSGPNRGRWSILLARGRDRRYLRDVPCDYRLGELWCEVDGEEVSGHTGTRANVWSVVDPGGPTG